MIKIEKDNPSWYFLVLTGFVIFDLLKPQSMYLSFLSPLRIPMLLTLAMAAIFFLNKKSYIKEDSVYKLAIAFWLVVSFSVVFAVNTRATYDASLLLFWSGLAFIFPLCVIVNNIEKLFRFIKLWSIIHVLLALIVIRTGGVGPGGYLLDENDVCLALVMGLPFLYYSSQFPEQTKIAKYTYLICSIIIIIAIVTTSSRGGFLGLAVVIGFFVLQSERPIRNGLYLLLFAAVATSTVIAMLPEAYVSDVQSITNLEESTADERLYSWSIAWVMFLENPVFGLGAANYAWTNHLYAELSPMWVPGRRVLGGRASHSIYFTVLPELGTIGAVLYYLLVRTVYRRCKQAKLGLQKILEEPVAKKFYLIFNACTASLFGFLISGAFISVLYYPFFWYLLGMVLVSYRINNNYLADNLNDIDNDNINKLFRT